MNEEIIGSTPKDQYKIKIEQLIKKQLSNILLRFGQPTRKEKKFTMQIYPYMVNKSFNSKEKDLINVLMVQCHKSKSNFKKLYKNDLKCRYRSHRNQRSNPYIHKLFSIKI